MKDIASIDFSDAYFNNDWLSSYGLIIASQNGLAPSNVQVSRTSKVESIFGRSGQLRVSTVINPRVWTIDLIITDFTRLREIAGYLNVLTPTDFYYLNDSVKISCMPDDGAVDTLSYGFMNYQNQQNIVAPISLKLIADDPYFKDINDLHYTFTNGSVLMTTSDGFNIGLSGNLVTGINFNCNGNTSAYPILKINGTGNIVGNINGSSFAMNNVNSYIYIDYYTKSVYKDLSDPSTNQRSDYQGDWFTLKAGINNIKVTSGTITSIEVFCNARYI